MELYSRKGSPALPFEHFLWLSWSVKESVYKCMKRGSPHLRFSPKKISIQDLTPQFLPAATGELDLGSPETSAITYRCVAESDSILFEASSTVHGSFISTLVTPPGTVAGKVWWGIRRVEKTDYVHQSEKVRLFALDKLQRLFPGDRLGFEKTAAGYPVLIRNSASLDLPISFSHHHNLIFYSFLW
jgi:hypothetical protein